MVCCLYRWDLLLKMRCLGWSDPVKERVSIFFTGIFVLLQCDLNQRIFMWSTTFCSLFLSSCWSVFGCTAKQWKRMITKATFVGPSFTRKPPKYERFIRPSGLRFTKAHVTHPELKCTFNLEIIGVKKNPNGPMYTSLGVMTKGTIIEVISTCNSSNNSFIYVISNAYHLNLPCEF